MDDFELSGRGLKFDEVSQHVWRRAVGQWEPGAPFGRIAGCKQQGVSHAGHPVEVRLSTAMQSTLEHDVERLRSVAEVSNLPSGSIELEGRHSSWNDLSGSDSELELLVRLR